MVGKRKRNPSSSSALGSINWLSSTTEADSPSTPRSAIAGTGTTHARPRRADAKAWSSSVLVHDAGPTMLTGPVRGVARWLRNEMAAAASSTAERTDQGSARSPPLHTVTVLISFDERTFLLRVGFVTDLRRWTLALAIYDRGKEWVDRKQAVTRHHTATARDTRSKARV
jgi:hypothetical protein